MHPLTEETRASDHRSSSVPTIVLMTTLALSLSARAVHAEPSVVALQRAAVRLAGLQPERARSLLTRAPRAALLPHVRLRVGRGGSGYVRGIDGVEQYTSTASDDWHFEVEAAWSL